MVRLDKIYTRAGDGGQTSLGDGERVSKDDPRVWAYGSVDETGAAIGAAIAAGLDADVADLLRRVQNDLFDSEPIWRCRSTPSAATVRAGCVSPPST